MIPEPASPTPMDMSGGAPDLCQAFSDMLIKDVDADDNDNLMLCSEYVKDIYKYLRLLEVCSGFPPALLSDLCPTVFLV